DLAVELADHACKLGEHHLDLPNAAALLIKLKALQTNKRVPRLHSGALLQIQRERVVTILWSQLREAGRCMTKVSPFLRQATTSCQLFPLRPNPVCGLAA